MHGSLTLDFFVCSSFFWQYDECDEVLAAAFGVDMLGNGKVDVILGPPCSNSKTRVINMALKVILQHFF